MLQIHTVKLTIARSDAMYLGLTKGHQNNIKGFLFNDYQVQGYQ